MAVVTNFLNNPAYAQYIHYLPDIVAFIAVFIFLLFVINRRNEPDKSELENMILQRRINVLAKQQDDLLDSAVDGRVSTFARASRGDLSSLDGKYGFIDKIKVAKKKAGINDISLEVFLLICCSGGIILSIVLIKFNFLNILTGVPVGMCVGFYLAFQFLGMQAERKKSLFLQEFPEAIDMMIRGVKAGLNIGRIMKLVSMEAKEPLAGEFRTISQKFDLGVEPEKALTDAADKIDVEEFRFLVVALILQIENGGMLGDILQNLADIVRKRLELALKLKAMSAEARMSAIIISVLPFIFAGIMALINPSHMQEFFKPGSGQTMLKIFITLFCMGTFFMIKATKIKV